MATGSLVRSSIKNITYHVHDFCVSEVDECNGEIISTNRECGFFGREIDLELQWQQDNGGCNLQVAGIKIHKEASKGK